MTAVPVTRPSILATLLLCVPVLTGCDDITGLNPETPPERTVDGVSTAVAAVVGTFAEGPLDRPYLLLSPEEFDRHYGGPDGDHEASLQVRAFFENGGASIWVLRVEEATANALVGSPGGATGVHGLDAADRFDLLFVPELFTAPEIGDRAAAAAEVVAYAETHDALVLLDPPAEVSTADEMITWLQSAGSPLARREAAAYFGRLEVPEPAGQDGTRWIGASGAVAGLYARNDRERGVWATPAGPELPVLGALDVTTLSDPDRDSLTGASVNPVVHSTSGEIHLWGGRTLSADPAMRYIAVSRLDTYLEARLRDALDWTEGHTTSPKLWTAAEAVAEAMLSELWHQGALQGAQPEEAWFARSDSTTHESDDVAENRLVVLYGFSAIRPEEFIVRELRLDL